MIQYACRPQTHHYTTSVTNKRQRKERTEEWEGAVYKINCFDCQASCIRETGGNLTIRLTEHKRATRKDDDYNHIAKCHEPCC